MENAPIVSNEISKTAEEIMIIRQEVAVMGSNDFEIPTIDRILKQLQDGEIRPAEALSRVREIQKMKQDYH